MKAIVIGSSSGGPKALEEIIKELPKDLRAVVVVVQHLPAQFTETMAKRFNANYDIAVSQMKNGETLQMSHAYIVPGDFHFFLTSPLLQTYLLRATGNVHPSINMGFTSTAEHFGPKTIGVILTGMGDDGTIGAKTIKQVGGYMIAQDKQSSAVYGMPQAVTESGLTDEVLPLRKIGKRLVELVEKDHG
jgi:two-component system chemotaxis response regulator CheB